MSRSHLVLEGQPILEPNPLKPYEFWRRQLARLECVTPSGTGAASEPA